MKNRLYQGILEKKIPVWVEYLGAAIMGIIFGCMFGFGF